MRLKPIVLGIATVLLLAVALGDQALQASGWYFGNADVLYMLKEGASDSAIKARIAEVQTAIFKFEAEDLAALRNAGASLGVISAMLARSRQTSGSDFAPGVMPAFKVVQAETLTLVTGQGQQEIEFSRGVMIMEGSLSNPAANERLEVPGLRADMRVNDRRPSVLVRSDSNPAKHYYLVKPTPIEKGSFRAIKINTHGFKPLLPDKKWLIAYTATAVEKGVWKITPEADLEPGEYGVLDGARLFGFGVDLP